MKDKKNFKKRKQEIIEDIKKEAQAKTKQTY